MERNLKTLIRTKNFCVLPFIHQAIDINQNIIPCCHSTYVVGQAVNGLNDAWTSEKMNDIREKMLNDVAVVACENCKNAEKNNGISPRIQSNSKWYNQFEELVQDSINELHLPISYDLRHTNLCNLKCKMCKPVDSSSLNSEVIQLRKKIKEFHLPNKYSNNNISFIKQDIELNTNIKQIYIAGGEPTIDPDIIDIIEIVKKSNSDTLLQINTNLNDLSDKFLNSINGIKNVQFIISLDGLNLVNDYIRWPGKFTNVIENAKMLHEKLNYPISFTIVVQALNIHSLMDLINFLQKNFSKSKILINPIVDPDYLGFNILPDGVKQTIDLNIDRLINKSDSVLVLHLKNLKKQLENSKFDKKLQEKFLKFNSIVDGHRKITYKHYIPELEVLFTA